MGRDADARLRAMESQVYGLSWRVAELERALAEETSSTGAAGPQAPHRAGPKPVAPQPGPAPAPAPRAPIPAAGPTAPVRDEASLHPSGGAPALETRPRSRPSISFEDLLGTRLLALAGGVAVLLGVAFFVAVAIGRGWLDEPTRIALAFLGSSTMLAAGMWLHERHGQTQASRALVGTAVTSLFLTLTAATQLYDLVPTPLALLLALALGATATAVALRLDSRTLAGLGIVGSLLSPALVGAGTSSGSLAFMTVALLAAVGVLLWRRWDWLALSAFAISAPQLGAWAVDAESALALVVVLSGFAVLFALAAIGYEVRVPGTGLRPSSALLLTASALLLAPLGRAELPELAGSSASGDLWIAVLALAHVALGVWAVRSARVSRAIALLLVVVGVILADVAFGLAAGGAGLAIGWVTVSVGFAALLGRGSFDHRLLRVAIAGHVALAAGHALLFEGSPVGFLEGFRDSSATLASLGGLGLGALIAARLVVARDRDLARSLDSVAALAIAYVTAAAVDGPALVAAWSAEAAAMAALPRRGDDTGVAGPFSLALLGVAALHVVSVEAPPDSLVFGAPDIGGAALALISLTAAAIVCEMLRVDREGGIYEEAAAIGLVYLGSIVIVSGFQPGGGGIEAGVGALDVRQQGQVLLSGLWSVLGLSALTVGLRMGARRMRLAGFALLALALAKLFLYDLQNLDSLYRVLSFLAIGLLLLAGAFAYQRMAPAEADVTRG